MINLTFSGYEITTADRSEIHIETSIDHWGGNIGLLSFDGLGASTVTQLNLPEARELAATLTEAIGRLENLAGGD